MQFFRVLVLLLLVSSALLFAAYAITGKQRLRHIGWVLLKWTLIAAFGFFAVLIAQRLL